MRGKHCAYFQAKAVYGLFWYKYLWDHFSFCPCTSYDPVSKEVKAFRYMGDFGLFRHCSKATGFTQPVPDEVR
jgi:hypothetical protein